LFAAYCELPDDSIDLYKWNGEHGDQSVLEQPKSGRFTAHRAAVHDEETNCWVVGVVIRLSRFAGSGNVVYFPLFVGENRDGATFRIGWIGEQKPLDLEDAIELHQSFDSVVDMIKGVYAGTQGEGKKAIGFHA
jgi:hypothetical protein